MEKHKWWGAFFIVLFTSAVVVVIYLIGLYLGPIGAVIYTGIFVIFACFWAGRVAQSGRDPDDLSDETEHGDDFP